MSYNFFWFNFCLRKFISFKFVTCNLVVIISHVIYALLVEIYDLKKMVIMICFIVSSIFRCSWCRAFGRRIWFDCGLFASTHVSQFLQCSFTIFNCIVSWVVNWWFFFTFNTSCKFYFVSFIWPVFNSHYIYMYVIESCLIV